MATTQSNVPLQIADVSDLVDLSITSMFMKFRPDVKEYHKEYYNIEAVSDLTLKDSSMSAVDSYGHTVENAIIKAASPVQGFDKSYTQAWFTGKLRVSKKMWVFGIQKRKLTGVVESMKKMALQTKEQILTNPLNNLATGSYTDTSGSSNFTHDNTGGDGVVMIATTHTNEAGGTDWNNQITDGATVNMDFDYDALKAARKTGEAIRGPIGEVMDQEFNTLICKKESSVHHRAEEILGAIKRNEIPDSADNDGSAIMAFKVLAIPYLTSDTAWFMLSANNVNANYGLQMKQGLPLNLNQMQIDKDNLEMSWVIDEFYQFGFNDARNIIGSDGTNV